MEPKPDSDGLCNVFGLHCWMLLFIRPWEAYFLRPESVAKSFSSQLCAQLSPSEGPQVQGVRGSDGGLQMIAPIARARLLKGLALSKRKKKSYLIKNDL